MIGWFHGAQTIFGQKKVMSGRLEIQIGSHTSGYKNYFVGSYNEPEKEVCSTWGTFDYTTGQRKIWAQKFFKARVFGTLCELLERQRKGECF